MAHLEVEIFREPVALVYITSSNSNRTNGMYTPATGSIIFNEPFTIKINLDTNVTTFPTAALSISNLRSLGQYNHNFPV